MNRSLERKKKSMSLPPAAAPPPRTYGIRLLHFPCFHFFSLPSLHLRGCRTMHMDSQLNREKMIKVGTEADISLLPLLSQLKEHEYAPFTLL